ncbi:MAG TPA: hypothetical protein GXZ24_03395 [Firmicutes bacterium]|nr:hypothetical protein [Bacillota bacterium]
MQAATAHKLNEMANREAYWEMKQELVFYYAFVYFLKQYRERILNQKGGLKELAEWESFVERYHQGSLTTNDLAEVDSLGFAIGLLMKQYSNSYFQKTKQDFVKHRVMKFGSRLSPEMIWKNGLLRCEELAQQWNMGLAINFRKNLPQVLLALLAAQQNNLLVAKKDEFLTAFWSGYLIYKKPDGDNTDEGDENNESQE